MKKPSESQEKVKIKDADQLLSKLRGDYVPIDFNAYSISDSQSNVLSKQEELSREELDK